MTTENGLTAPSHMRRNIETFRRRLEHVTARMDSYRAEGRGPSGFDEAEAHALAWALPVLEAEWDAAVRLAATIDTMADPRDRITQEGRAARRAYRIEHAQEAGR